MIDRTILNRERAQKIHSFIRPNILAVIADLEGAGWQPVIDGGVYRTPVEQATMVARGVSTVYYSYHNVTGKDGTPESMAADIVDIRYGWNPSARYWLELAAAAENQGLETGIYWGLSQANRNIIHTAIGRRDYGATYSRGWDAAHVQPPQSKFTINQARDGYRYNPGAVRANILKNTESPLTHGYKLFATDGHVMDLLQVHNGTAYVPARKWGAWLGIDVRYDASNAKVLFNDQPVETLLIDGTGYVPIRKAAEFCGLGLIVDEVKRTIQITK